ncbi:hypothetical protein AKJ65_07330 [candidate division MSBL1 archaeon SCGC-AAA259E19]|uniref:Uncharacterized protein n=1 Tax=candidate division MSBL1 archaeon SCGC-AAA259E19 TaxID=1698264 RepID=A0A133UEG3_9EURY|nr:hypothetical protein AKJ65_07330 [candidate division MSBL1 archaeon SCGC-AAA259E19]
MSYEDLGVHLSTVYGWVWKLSFRELTKEERLKLSRDLVRCSLFDQVKPFSSLRSKNVCEK